jgi:DNA topoisomerase-2
MTRKSVISQKYQKKSHLQHIQERPDTYIGSCDERTESLWVLDNNKMVHRDVTFVPGFLKIFDEILVNAADNKRRDSSMKSIKVTICNDHISIENDGQGIPVVMHETEQMYVPQMVFGELLSGDNYDDSSDRVVGGRNGYGAKLANIFSSLFCVETIDSKAGKKYSQRWHQNMSKVDPPVIQSAGKRKDFTRITFAPDYAKFGLEGLTPDILALFHKRVYDMAGTTPHDVIVYLNGERVPVRNFKQYCSLYFQDETKMLYEKINERWEVCVTVSQDQQAQQVSFCNAICTTSGGEHVRHILDEISRRVLPHRSLKDLNVRPSLVKLSTFVFVNALITNPSFDSQTKEKLTTRASKFGPEHLKPTISEKFAGSILRNSGIVAEVLFYARAKSQRLLEKKTATRKSTKMTIAKLDDARKAGTRQSSECTLILTEGDSAKSLAIAGLAVIGRDKFGVFPLKGKLLNVRDATNQKVMENKEVQNIMKIMGLNIGRTYSDVSALRYGHIMIMTDQDHDGSHIKGLIINLIQHFWPSLLQIPDFLQVFITPIVKCTQGPRALRFYTTPEYEAFAAANDIKKWKVKYYKGLGTSSAKEAREYFSALHRNRIPFQCMTEKGTALIDMCFSKTKSKERKEWISSYQRGTHVDFNVTEMSYDDFVNKEYIVMGVQSNLRAIPSAMDGLKTSQRKILFACLKRNLKDEIKVAQLAGYTSEHAVYHHGEASLNATIINMAQNYIGSNNINLLKPNGQFGTRLIGGKDAASPRYVFTQLNEITGQLFHPDDAALYEYMEEDGQQIEPPHYMPVLPMLLVNGSNGIGTGWSTVIHQYNPLDIIQNIRMRLKGQMPPILVPWYRGFRGTIRKNGDEFLMTGCWTWKNAQTLHISELPVGTWTSPYKEFLENAMDGKNGFKSDAIKNVDSQHTDNQVSFDVKLRPDLADALQKDETSLVKLFKLQKKLTLTNMHAFDCNGHLKKYHNTADILDEYFQQRIALYARRKEHMLKCLSGRHQRLVQKIQFLQLVVNGQYIFKGCSKKQLTEQLQQHSLGDAEHLLSMSMWNMTDDKIAELCAQRDECQRTIQTLNALEVQQLWLNDLKQVEKKYQQQFKSISTEQPETRPKKRKKKN